MAYFKCKGEVGENPEYLYDWDFTKSLTDRVTGTVATLTSATRTDENGITLLNSDSQVSITVPSGITLLANGRTLEIDFGTVSKSFSDRHGRFIMCDDDDGFIFRKGSNLWQVYSSAWRNYTETSNNPDVFSEKTLKMIFNTNSLMNVYANDELVYSGDSLFRNSSHSVIIGSSSQSFINADIKALRIYENQ